MSDQIRMDSHKLMFHPERVAAWLWGENIYPLEMEIGLSGVCNHRCIFCAVDYLEYHAKFLQKDVLIKNLKILEKKGLKSIIYSGEGEPLLHPEAVTIFNQSKGFGIDIALATNGVLLNKEMAKECLQSFSWIRFSIAAGTAKTYEAIHQAKKGDFQKVLQNLADAVEIKKAKKMQVTLGAQLLLLPENQNEVVFLAKTLREIGLDYLTVKPFSQHPQSKIKREVNYKDSVSLEKELHEYKSDKFQIYFRKQSIENLVGEKSYNRCRGLDFMTHIDAQGNVFPCVAFVGVDKFCYGNIYKNTFEEIWNSTRARQIKNIFADSFLKEHCRKACRLDEINKYLHELSQPGNHVNFI